MKLFLKIFCIFLALLLSGCAVETDSPPSEIKIGVLFYQLEDPFIAKFADYMKTCTEELEAQVDFRISIQFMDGKGQQSVQDEQLNRLIDFEYDVLCINMVDRTLAAGVIDKAKTENIPVVFFNREPVEEDMQRWDKIFYVGAKASEGGIIQGQIIENEYQSNLEKWDINGDGFLQYVILEGEANHQDSLIRTESAITYLMNAGVKIERLSSKSADWKRAPAEAATAQWIDTFGDSIEVVISNNDNMALGAIDAYKDIGAERFPLIVGVDGIEPALNAIKAGQMVGTTFNDSKSQSYAIVETAVGLALPASYPKLQGLAVAERYIWVPHNAITADNIDSMLSSVE